jgi:hypothetical protein
MSTELSAIQVVAREVANSSVHAVLGLQHEDWAGPTLLIHVEVEQPLKQG